MAAKKPLVVSSSGLLEELQSGDTLEGAGGGSGEFYLLIHIAGGFGNVSTNTSSSTPSLEAVGRLDRSALPSSFTCKILAYVSGSFSSTGGNVRIDAVNGGSTTLGTAVMDPDADLTERLVEEDITSNVSSLASGEYEIELYLNQDVGSGAIRLHKCFLEFT